MNKMFKLAFINYIKEAATLFQGLKDKLRKKTIQALTKSKGTGSLSKRLAKSIVPAGKQTAQQMPSIGGSFLRGIKDPKRAKLLANMKAEKTVNRSGLMSRLGVG